MKCSPKLNIDVEHPACIDHFPIKIGFSMVFYIPQAGDIILWCTVKHSPSDPGRSGSSKALAVKSTEP